MNTGSSLYHSTLGFYCRDHDGTLLAVEGREAEAITAAWPQIWTQLSTCHPDQNTLRPPQVIDMSSIMNPEAGPFFRAETSTLHARELYQDSDRCCVGLISGRSDLSGDREFRDLMESFLLSQTTLRPRHIVNPPPSLTPTKTCHPIADGIVDVFERMLLSTPRDDQWGISGRAYFHRRVLDFLHRGEPCHFILPAFPCKSPNQLKVGGVKPDLGERIAIEQLHAFVRSLQKMYRPGAIVSIIHDGHVLASCVGVDDDQVSEYESNLQAINKVVQESHALPADGLAEVRFRTLTDLVPNLEGEKSKQTCLSRQKKPSQAMAAGESHGPALARGILEAASGIDRKQLRGLLEAQDPRALQTYRGLSRFILDDLQGGLPRGDKQSGEKPWSTSKRKKVAQATAEEMMARNQAFANYIELLFPDCIRLSIHGHNNAGPKFGIRLLPAARVRAIRSLDDAGPHVSASSAPLDFQVPTPWHNSVLHVAGDDVLYLARASVAQDAVASGEYAGGWTDGGAPGGGHFALSRCGRGGDGCDSSRNLTAAVPVADPAVTSPDVAVSWAVILTRWTNLVNGLFVLARATFSTVVLGIVWDVTGTPRAKL